MYQIQIDYHKEYFQFLHLNELPMNETTFKFLHKEHFIDLTSSFITDYMIELEVNKLIKNRLIEVDEKETFSNLIDFQFKNELHLLISNLLSQQNKQDRFSLKRFMHSFSNDIQKHIQRTLYDHLAYSNSYKNDLKLGLEKEDVIYMVLEPNGSVTLEKKDCTVIGNFSYFQQEQAVAEVVYILNPFQLIVYDPLHLLQPEMTICLKKLLKGKVVFLEQEHPLRENRTF